MDMKNEVMQDITALIEKYNNALGGREGGEDGKFLIDAIENLEWVVRELREWSICVAVARADGSEETKRLKPLSAKR